MFFSAALYVSLGLCLLGLILRAKNWFKVTVGQDALAFSSCERLEAAAKALAAYLFSPRILILLKVFFRDVVFQVPLLKDDALRWVMHIFLYWGFMLLLLMHALDSLLLENLFVEYAPTINPFLFLRNLFGLMVILGMLIALYRRIALRGYRLPSSARDHIALFLLALIMLSGFALEALKISSATLFNEMVEDYATLETDEDLPLLKAYWADRFGVAFPDGQVSRGRVLPDRTLLNQGRELHEENCAACHSRPVWAFVSYPLSRSLRSPALSTDRGPLRDWLWLVHILSCFVALAYLPFSKFLHLLSSPLSLLIRGASGDRIVLQANRITRRAMGLDACMHCGTCSRHCSVAPIFQRLENRNILPSEKLQSVKALSRGRPLEPSRMQAIQEGSFICTGCTRCTQLCPAGINLQDLWLSSREDLIAGGFPDPHPWARDRNRGDWGPEIPDRDKPMMIQAGSPPEYPALSEQAETFSGCFECQTCTNVCPVVAVYEDPRGALDLMPHQIMHALGLGFREESVGSRMVWDCVTCYMCQEHCPQGVRVTDVLYELKNLAYERAKKAAGTRNDSMEVA